MRALVLLVAFVVVPLLELLVIAQVSGQIGLVPTLLALLLVSVVGAWLVKREGARAWRHFRERLAAGGAPTEEVVDGALVLVGGTLLLTPGFLTDLLGFSLVFPPSRALWNGVVRRRARGSFMTLVVGRAGSFPGGGASSGGASGGSGRAGPAGRGAGGSARADGARVVDAEVLGVERRRE